MKLLNKKGDTIVEVMIAVVVLGAALGSAFAISNRSVSQTQANHERYQIQLWVNQQAELLRTDYATFLKSGKDRVDYEIVEFTTSGLCDPTCNKPEYGGVIITVKDNSGISSSLISDPDFIKSYIITATWNSLATGNESQVELIYDI